MLPDFRVRQRDYLLEISRALTEELDLATVLQRILQTTAELLAGEAGLGGLRGEEGRWPGGGPPRRGARRGRGAPAAAPSLGLRQGVALPMVARAEVVGVIYIFRGYPTAF